MRRVLLLSIPAAVVVALATLVASAFAATPDKVDPHKAIVVSSDEASAILDRVLPADKRHLSYQGTADRPGVRVHLFAGADVTGAVDVSDGHVTMLTLPVPTETGGATTITADQATRTAFAFLESIGSPVDGFGVGVAAETGSGTPGYTVTLTRMSGNVVLPDYRVVEVDGITGTVFSFVDVRRPYNPPPPPTVTAKQATATAIAKVGGGSAPSPRLGVTFDAAGNQVLVWEVAVTPTSVGAPGIVVEIDAQTGLPFDQ